MFPFSFVTFSKWSHTVDLGAIVFLFAWSRLLHFPGFELDAEAAVAAKSTAATCGWVEIILSFMAQAEIKHHHHHRYVLGIQTTWGMNSKSINKVTNITYMYSFKSYTNHPLRIQEFYFNQSTINTETISSWIFMLPHIHSHKEHKLLLEMHLWKEGKHNSSITINMSDNIQQELQTVPNISLPYKLIFNLLRTTNCSKYFTASANVKRAILVSYWM